MAPNCGGAVTKAAQIWYLARDGNIVLQGSRADLAKAARGGFLRGDEAAWTEGMMGWEAVGDSRTCAWLREAGKVHEDMTGTLLQYRSPEGTDELEIPREPAWAQQSPSEGKPAKERRSQDQRGRRKSDHPVRRRPAMLLGTLIGVVTALALIQFLPRINAEPATGAEQGTAAVPNMPSPTADPATTAALRPDSGLHKGAADTGMKPRPKGETTREPATTIQRASETKPSTDSTTAKPRIVQQGNASGAKDLAREALESAAAERQDDAGTRTPVRSANREAELRRSLATRSAKFTHCLRSAKIAKPGLRGKVTFVISVSSAGSVTGVRSASGRPGPEYAAACLLGELENLKFPPGAGIQVRIKAAVP